MKIDYFFSTTIYFDTKIFNDVAQMFAVSAGGKIIK